MKSLDSSRAARAFSRGAIAVRLIVLRPLIPPDADEASECIAPVCEVRGILESACVSGALMLTYGFCITTPPRRLRADSEGSPRTP